MKFILAIFHKSDLDGLCCEAIARKFLGDSADYLGFEYNDPIPDLSSYRTVLLMDISLPPEVMAANRDKIVWIDHHKSAIEKMAGKGIDGYQIDGVAACRLTFQYFLREWRCRHDMIWLLPDKKQFDDKQVQEPYAVQLLGLYDVWRKETPEVDTFQLGMQAEKKPNWDLLLKTPEEAKDEEYHRQDAYIEGIITAGEAIQSYTEATNAQISVERGFNVEWEGLKFRCLNIARCSSMTFLAALKPEHDACLAYFYNGILWKFSLYHAPGKERHDLSKIAVKHGGGGHPGACGFALATLPEQFGK